MHLNIYFFAIYSKIAFQSFIYRDLEKKNLHLSWFREETTSFISFYFLQPHGDDRVFLVLPGRRSVLEMSYIVSK